MKRYIHRHLPMPVWRFIPVAGIGACLAVWVLGALSQYSGLALMMMPFGASCVLLFATHSSPLSQPVNVVGGHVVAACVGVAGHFIWPEAFTMAGAVLGIALMAIMALRVVHPPAGATALVAYHTATSWFYIFCPVLVGSLILVGLALIYHQLTDNIYPLHHPDHRHRS